MIKSVINKAVKAALDELFVDAPSVQLSMGADIFSDSKINLSNLTLRPDIFDISLQPFTLVHGHLGTLNVEGIAELALGGKLKFNAENLFLLFELDTVADPEKVQNIKKILLELQTGRFTPLILSEVLRRIQGLSTAPDVDVAKKRRVIYKALDYLSRGVFLSVRSIHVRFEFKCADAGADAASSASLSLCNAVGLLVPLVKFSPAPAAQRPDNISRSDPCFLTSVKSAQIYCDYQRESYFRLSPSSSSSSRSVRSAAQIAQHFLAQWRQEVHSALVAPFDVDVVLGLGIKRKAGLVCPNIVIRAPAVRLSVDERQVAVLAQIALELTQATKKFAQAAKIQKIFRNGFPLPRVQAVGGIRLLPHLYLKGHAYPAQHSAIPSSAQRGLVAFMRERVGARWPVMLWKHLIRVVLHDLQKARPLGRWVEIARLAYVRKDYAFLYAQYFKKNGDNGQFVFNPMAPVSAVKARQLFEYEMQLSPQAVAVFRSLAYMLAVAAGLYNKKKSLASGNGNNNNSQRLSEGAPGWERVFIGWREVLCVHTELFEAHRETGFHRFDRSRQDTSDDADDLWEDNATVHSDDNNSVYSFAMRSSAKAPNTPTRTPRAAESPVPSTGQRQGLQKFFGSFNLNNIASVFTPADEFDRKFLGKFDLNAFNDILGSMIETSAHGHGKAEKEVEAPTITPDVETALRRGTSSAKAIVPDMHNVAEAVLWAMNKYQDAITWLPPDLNINLERVQCELKTPATLTQRERTPVAALTLRSVTATVNISQSSSQDHGFAALPHSAVNGTPSAKTQTQTQAKTARGFASLSGALVQFRLVCRSLAISLQLAPPIQPNAPAQMPMRNSVLTTGLPAYPIALSLRRENSGDSLHSASTSEEDEEKDVVSDNNININKRSNNTQRERESVASDEKDGESEGDASLTDSLTQTQTQSVRVTDSEKERLKSIPGVSFQYRPGETVLQSLQRMRAERDAEDARKILDEMSDEEGEGGENKTFTIDSSFHEASRKPINNNINASNISAKPMVSTKSAFPVASGELKEILSSAPGDNAFVFCTILDLDELGEGAGDVQLQCGGYRVDVSKRVAATLSLPTFSDRVRAVFRHKQAMDEALALRALPHVLVDWAQSAPLVLLAVDPPLSVLDEMLELEKEKRALAHTHPSSQTLNTLHSASKSIVSHTVGQTHVHWHQKEGENDDATVSTLGDETSVLIDDSQESVRAAQRRLQESINERLRDDSDGGVPRESEGGEEDNALSAEEVLRERRKRRAAIAFNKNIMQWLAVLESHLPKVLSLCMRTSPVIVQSLEATVIRDLVHAKMQAVIDSASKRRKDSGLSEFFPIDHVLGLLRHLVLGGFDDSIENVEFNNRVAEYRRRRRWGARAAIPTARRLNFAHSGSPSSSSSAAAANANNNQSQAAPQSAFKLKMLIPGVDLILAKALVPYPAVDVHLQGVNVLKLPVSDETLCYYLAWMLAELMPIYF